MKYDTQSEQWRRPYRMKVRAEAAAATEEHILEAGLSLFGVQPYDRISLEEIAAQAQVTVQTVIRRFGSKERLFSAVTQRAIERAFQDRGKAHVGDISDAIAKLVDHYEKWGDLALHLLAQAEQIAAVCEVTDAGRSSHHQWVERTFFPLLEDLAPPRRQRRLAQLIAMTDVHVWKVFRRDLGLSTGETEQALVEAIAALWK